MPCYEVRTMNVEFIAKNVKLLEEALTALKWKFTKTDSKIKIGDITLDLEAGKATLPTTAQEKLNELKRAYSMQVIKTASAANGWSIQNVKEKGRVTIGTMYKY